MNRKRNRDLRRKLVSHKGDGWLCKGEVAIGRDGWVAKERDEWRGGEMRRGMCGAEKDGWLC